jgi:hypothetical protein
MPKIVTILLVVMLITAPMQVNAAIHFGGPIQTVIGCINDGLIYTVIGQPRGGEYIWSPNTTDTYSFGPPRRTGQWLLGNAGPSHFCLVSVHPIDPRPGLIMLMLGSSR